MAEMTVKVRGKDRVVQVHQKSRSSGWIATGKDIDGESISAEGRTESAAAKAWREKLDYHNK